MFRFRWTFGAVVLLAFTLMAAAEAGPVFKRREFKLTQGVWGVDVIDVNADGKQDMIAVGDTKVWAMLAPDWRVVEIGDTPGGRTIHAVSLDCDADGDLDLCVGRSASHWIAYRLSRGKGKQRPKPDGADFTVAWLENTGKIDKPWPVHILDRELHGVHGLWKGDVNRDGTTDLIADSFAGPHLESSLAWFPAPTKTNTTRPMKRHMITTGKATGRPHYMHFADINADGRGDVLLGASREGSFTWWEQPKALTSEWKRHVIANTPGATHPRAVDLNGDGKLDVIGSAGHGVGIYWFEAPKWKQHIIDSDIRDVHAFDAADIDGDGDMDCAGCSFSQGIVRWWENVGNGRFVKHDIDTQNKQQAYDVKLLDLDADGRLDILLAGRRSNNAIWYRNVKP